MCVARRSFVHFEMDVLSLNQQFIRELLELYKELPAVWKVKCPEYKNKMAKTRAYDLLVQKCREYVPDADREFVKNKINSLRTSFRKEQRKVQISQGNASDPSEVYVPNLWYYNLLLFTADQEDSRPYTVKHIDNSSFLNDQVQDENNFYDFKSEPHSPQLLVEERDPLCSTNEPPIPRKKPRPETVVTRLSATSEDVFDAIGKNVAHKLRGMTQQQRIIAEKIISDVMYHGQMETLTVDSHLSLNKNSS